MKQRTLTALILAPLAIALILLPPTPVFALVVAVAFLLALWEWTRLAGFRDRRTRGAIMAGYAALFVLLWTLRGTVAWPAAIMAGVAWWAVALLWLRHYAFGAAPTRENGWLKLGAGALVVLPAWAALVQVHGSEQHGHLWTLLALMIVWAADTAAYLAGSRYGRRKLAPRISPGKTIAGVWGALAGAALIALVGGPLLGVGGFALAGLVVLALFTTAISIVGDLFESLIKRHADVKDSGALFPGHGGLFDRLDSVFAALPVFVVGKAMLEAMLGL
ncbi:MAG: phosphatidate cytidylyltransferase [Mizugakiibacter sp.]|uniref:phosphatidate cytidylyltransferase n=1 Tax=Mizugakiibacter sp. TaxID=1972610 RepID=UPI0031C945D3|nr:phosphatidate cytidylyltransferase [Xanthomonadaceae bacterium]